MTDEVKQRWRVPVRPLAVRDDLGFASADLGRMTGEYTARFSESDIERIRLGYVCIKCWEPHEVSFPERCALCGFPIRDEQRIEFDHKFKGPERNPRAVLIEKELDALDDRHERNFHVTKAGVVIPRRI